METVRTLYYTDGHQVTISDSIIKVKNTIYRLNGITRHGFSIVTPKRVASISLMIFGAIGFVIGAVNFIPRSWSTTVAILGAHLLVNSLIMAGGTLLFLVGVIIFIRSREKYAVRIFTAEGEKNLVVSASREYITQIVDALTRAFLDLTKREG